MCPRRCNFGEVVAVVLFVRFEVFLDLADLRHDSIPVRIRGKHRLPVVHFHDTNAFGHLLDLAILFAIFVLLLYHIAALDIQLQIRRRAKAVTPTRTHRSARRRSTFARPSVRHERQHQPLQPIYAILHIIWSLVRRARSALLLALGRRIVARRGVAALDAVVARRTAVALQLAVSAWSAGERHAIALAHYAELLVVGRCAVGGRGGGRRGLVSRRHFWDWGLSRVVGCAGREYEGRTDSRPMRASQRVWVGVVDAFATSVAGQKLAIGTVFRLDRRSLRSSQQPGLRAAATRAKTLAWTSVADD